MGADYYSYAVIGVKIDPEKLTKVTQVRGCDCDTDLTGKFCSNCGAEIFVEEEENIPEYDEDKETLYDHKIIFRTDNETAIVAVIFAKDKDYNKDNNHSFEQIPDNIKELKEELKNTLSPLGFWDEKEFGLWSVLYCSY